MAGPTVVSSSPRPHFNYIFPCTCMHSRVNVIGVCTYVYVCIQKKNLNAGVYNQWTGLLDSPFNHKFDLWYSKCPCISAIQRYQYSVLGFSSKVKLSCMVASSNEHSCYTGVVGGEWWIMIYSWFGAIMAKRQPCRSPVHGVGEGRGGGCHRG